MPLQPSGVEGVGESCWTVSADPGVSLSWPWDSVPSPCPGSKLRLQSEMHMLVSESIRWGQLAYRNVNKVDRQDTDARTDRESP